MNPHFPSVRHIHRATTLGFAEIEYGCSESLRYSISRNDRLSRYSYTAVVKVDGGIWHLTANTPPDPPEMMLAEARTHGTFSARPYHLGQQHDSSVGLCVLTLYNAFCRTRQWDPATLLSQAYPGWERATDWPEDLWHEIHEAAHWEGLVEPTSWGNPEVRLLGQSLRELGREWLAELIEARALIAGSTHERG
jgi:hypothetical protein